MPIPNLERQVRVLRGWTWRGRRAGIPRQRAVLLKREIRKLRFQILWHDHFVPPFAVLILLAWHTDEKPGCRLCYLESFDRDRVSGFYIKKCFQGRRSLRKTHVQYFHDISSLYGEFS